MQMETTLLRSSVPLGVRSIISRFARNRLLVGGAALSLIAAGFDLAMELACRDRRGALAAERRAVRSDVRARLVHASHKQPHGRGREPNFGNTFTATGEVA